MSSLPIIDVEAREHVPPEALAPREADPQVPPCALPPAGWLDPMQVLHVQRRLLREQQQVLRDMLTQLELPPSASVPRTTPGADLLTRSMAALDRSLGAIMHSLEHTFGTEGRGRPTQGTDR
ncbi:MAG: hypothetical protein K1X88_05180 [Nannocystaceae bacterium]|nr:hypothetical protein [Nannocystaceae bacterium]